MKINKNFLVDNLVSLFYALVIAIIIRSLIFQPFFIPSSSMEPTLLVGDRIFVSKYSYGYSKHSFPFSPSIFGKRIFSSTPNRGDVIVFKTPSDNRTDYIKRLVGLPGDNIQFIDGDLFMNSNQVLKTLKSSSDIIFCGNKSFPVNTFQELMPNGKKHVSVYSKKYTFQNSDKFIIPSKHYFFLGDNRDCSKDSRYLASVGYVHEDNLVGKAQIIFFSSNFKVASIFKFWKWNKSIRINRFFKKIK